MYLDYCFTYKYKIGYLKTDFLPQYWGAIYGFNSGYHEMYATVEEQWLILIKLKQSEKLNFTI